MTPVSLIRDVHHPASDGIRFEAHRVDQSARHDSATRRLLQLSAARDLTDLATGRFASHCVGVDIDLDVSESVEYLGFAFTQFALPVTAGADMGFDFRPAHNLRSPAAMLPLVVADRGRALLIAPLTNPHEQIITAANGTVRWGWHGDLETIAAGFTTDVAIYEGAAVGELLEWWGADLRDAASVVRRPRSANPVTSHLSYWSDNGAAYWYRTEPGQPITESIATTIADLHEIGVPVRAVELDSWFYPHETTRAIAEIGYPDEVPPSGALTWSPRPDAFPPCGASQDPLELFHRRVDRAPLILHARHISPASPYVGRDWWVDDVAAHPPDPSFFRQWFDDAARWGAVCIEQDWMLMYWFGVRSIRAVPGRAAAWQRALNEHAAATGVDVMWCMATPADLIAAVEFDRVIAVRTSDDYRFADDPALLWTWFLTVNRLVRPLGLWPFKDCFFSSPTPDPDDPLSGDEHAELESLLSAMSGGPIGIGDRIGRTDRDIVMRTCDDDGRLRHTDTPIGLIDACLFGAPARGERLAWSTTYNRVGDHTYTYIVAINTATNARPISDALALSEVGLAPGTRWLYDWRNRTMIDSASTPTSTDTIELTLDCRDWALFICGDSESGIIDPDKYVQVVSRPS